jgi:hypothetical protein
MNEKYERPQREVQAIYNEITPASDEVFVHLHELLVNQPNCDASIAAICMDEYKADKLVGWLEFTQKNMPSDKGKFVYATMDKNSGWMRDVSSWSNGEFSPIKFEFQSLTETEHMISRLRGINRGNEWEDMVQSGYIYQDISRLLGLINYSKRDLGKNPTIDQKSDHLVVEAFIDFLGLTGPQIELLQQYTETYENQDRTEKSPAVLIKDEEIGDVQQQIKQLNMHLEELTDQRNELIRGMHGGARHQMQNAPEAFDAVFRE